MAHKKEFYVVYESGQVESAHAHAARGSAVFCLDFLVEQELRKENIPFVSLRDIVDAETGEEEWWLLAQDIAREWYRLPAMQFFAYKGIRIAEVLEPIVVEAYLTRLLYYARVYLAFKKANPEARLLIPETPVTGAEEDCLVSFERRAVTDAARLARAEHTVLEAAGAPQERSSPALEWKRLFVRAYNLCMGFLPRRPLKIYASEYWSHIGPVMEQMKDAELVLLDEGGELSHIPWRQLFKHRIRTRHPNGSVRETERKAAARISATFSANWGAAKGEVAQYLAGMRGELDWGPVLEAFEYLMAYAREVIADIDAVRRIMREEKPDVVAQIASVGGRHHYFLILARVAAELGIPSVELQHASAYMDSRVVYSRVETDYLAAFGATAASWHKRSGISSDRLIVAGSARFDQYLTERAGARERGKEMLKQLGLDVSRPIVLATVPYLSANFYHLDSYQMADFFRTFRDAQKKIPGLQVLFKCRNNRLVASARAYAKMFCPKDCAVTGGGDIFALLCASDAAVCGRSTIIYQAMLAEKPLLLYPWKAYDTQDAEVYAPAAPLARAGGEAVETLARIFSDLSYREEVLARGREFLKGYSFDGGASKRIVSLIEHVALKRHEPTRR